VGGAARSSRSFRRGGGSLCILVYLSANAKPQTNLDRPDAAGCPELAGPAAFQCEPDTQRSERCIHPAQPTDRPGARARLAPAAGRVVGDDDFFTLAGVSSSGSRTASAPRLSRAQRDIFAGVRLRRATPRPAAGFGAHHDVFADGGRPRPRGPGLLARYASKRPPAAAAIVTSEGSPRESRLRLKVV